MMRNPPMVPLSPCPESFARLVLQGFDTVQEAFAFELLPSLVKILTDAKEAAAALSDNLDATVECDLNGHKLNVHATGARGGVRWRLEDDDILILIGSPARGWPVSVRYLSAGLWEHGLEALRTRVFHALAPYTRRRSIDCVRVTRVDWCFDFYSPEFTREFLPRLAESIVCHSSTKSELAGKFDVWSRGPRGETLTIGSKSGLQVQLYDKTLEIHEASGKTWLYDIWRERLGFDPWGSQRPRDIYRLECRFSKAFLKERNIRRPHEIKSSLGPLVTEALYTRRLALPNPSDSHRHRWPLHPFWSEALRQFNAGSFVPVGRKVTGRRSALVDDMERALAGTLRSAAVLEKGNYSESNVIAFMDRARKRIERDPHHERKLEAARNRYSNVDEAR